ncbi:MAG: tetratricopeptide repeat protein [Prevotella sp.]|nr:tetratricopeptide repeat protein [Prevotella sp.]
MRHYWTKVIAPLTLAATLLAILSCSSQKNTAKSRFWQSFTAKYNTYYNGTLAYIDGSLEKENGNKDNYTEMIPLYPVANKQSREIGKGNYEKAIEKCQKAIKLHSINKRPEWTKNRRKTARDIEWLNRREYNPMLWKAWLLMGRSQFHKGAFDEAAATFSYMSRLYQTQPAIYGKARAWLAKCYIEQDWLYDAEDVIRNMSRDSIDWHAQKEWDYTYADYYIHMGDYERAIPYLRKVIKHEMRRKQRAREWFLLGQLEAELGHRDAAYKAFRKVCRQNPPYELDFNARIAMTEVMAAGKTKQTISRLKRMAANDNNKDYLDQVYYAMGNVYLLDKDTTNAIAAYEKGNEKGTRSGVEKGVLLLKLGDLYWEKEKYGDAQHCYGAAIGMLDKERKDYEELSRRSKILDELAPHTESIHLQDSLLALSEMSEKERNEAIDRVIEALKKKEREERRKQEEANAQQVQQRNGAVGNRNQTAPTTPQTNEQKGEWYFYNQLAVSQGKATFQKQWGKRENADNWRRVNKTVVSDLTFDGSGDALQDSLAAAQQAIEDSLAAAAPDSAQNDPHKREYYLAQIPFTEEQKAECHAAISDGLFNSGIIFKDKFDNLRLSEKQFNRLTLSYPDFEKMDEVYYHLFLLYSRKGETTIADGYVNKLRERYPNSQWTTILTDPYYVENSKWGEHIEDSLYAATYEAFKADRYQEVFGNAHISETRFPLGANRDKFVFIRGLSRLNNSDSDGCLEDMNYVVKNYPSSRISEMAGMIVNGVKAGRKLHGGKFDLGDVWSRRAAVLNDSDSIAARRFVADRNKDFLFIIAYSPDSLNENQLLFEMARFNFTTFMVRNFDIEIEDADGIHLMKLSGFRNFDEAHQYASEVQSQANIVRLTRKARIILISSDNVELLGKQFSYDDYEEFYAKHFAPLKVRTEYLLSEPTEIGYEKEVDMKDALPKRDAEGGTDDDGMSIDDNVGGGNAVDEGFDLPEETPDTPANDDNGFNLPDTPAPTNPTQGSQPPAQNAVDVPTENDNVVIPTNDDNVEIPSTDDNVVVPTNDDNVTPPTDDVVIPSVEDNQNTIPDDDSYDLNDDNVVVPPAGSVVPTVPQGNDIEIEENDNNNGGNAQEDEYILEVKRQDNKGQANKPSTSRDIKPKADKKANASGNAPIQEEVALPTPSSQTQPKQRQEDKTKSRPQQESPKAKPQQDTPKAKPQQNTPVVKQQQDTPVVKQQQDTDDNIVFDDEYDLDDDTPPVPSSPKKKKEKELDDLDLEDEYYELDGF